MVRDRQIGIVFGFDVARLARNSLDWSLLIHWCALHSTLIGDQHHVYDPAVPQDSLSLGIQGVLAVHELNTIHQRLRVRWTRKPRAANCITACHAGMSWWKGSISASIPTAACKR